MNTFISMARGQAIRVQSSILSAITRCYSGFISSSLSPVFFVYPALTLGKKDIGFVTFMPLFGVGQTSLDGGFLPFIGVSVGAIGFTKSFVLKPGGE